MDYYKKLYLTLFHSMTDAIEQLEANQSSLALLTLEQGQKAAEALYVELVPPQEECLPL